MHQLAALLEMARDLADAGKDAAHCASGPARKGILECNGALRLAIAPVSSSIPIQESAQQ